jgi:hypothetical protein
LELREPIYNLKHLSGRKYSFDKITQSSEGNNVLPDPVSNQDGFLSRDTCFPSTEVDRPVWRQRA